MSLRARLLIGLIVLTATGLVIAGLVTYAAERSFLVSRVDQQLTGTSNVNGFEDVLDADLGLSKPAPGTGAGGHGPFPGAFGAPGRGQPAAGLLLPSGTWGIYRPASGQAQGYHVPP